MNKHRYIIIIITTGFLFSCSTNKELIGKEKTEFGTVKYYVENDLKNNRHEKQIIAKVDNSIFYSFCSDKIVKQTKQNKELIYTLFYEEIPEELNDSKYYQKLSKLDSLVLTESGKI